LRPLRSRRQVAADLALLCDQVEAETEAERRRPTDEELIAVRNALLVLLPVALDPLDLFDARVVERVRRLARDLATVELEKMKAAEPPAEPPPAPAPAPAPAASKWRLITGGIERGVW
jgi:hypothetical protein